MPTPLPLPPSSRSFPPPGPDHRRTTPRFHPALLVSGALWLSLAAPGTAQTPMERSPLLERSGVGLPWLLEVNPQLRARRSGDAPGLTVVSGIHLGLGLPGRTFVGTRFVPHSPTVPGTPDEWEVRARISPLLGEPGAPLGLAATLGYNGAARSVDADVTAARWLGPVRLSASARFLSDAQGAGASRGALGAGAVLLPWPRSVPLSLTGDIVRGLDGGGGEAAGWSAGVALGVPYSNHAISLFVTNTSSGTLQGTTAGGGETRLGIGFTAPIPLGRTLGRVVPREQAMEAVSIGEEARPAIRTTIVRHAFPAQRIEVDAGSTVEWTNQDQVIHTVSADDGGWDSGAIAPGERWAARFDEPGLYPFHCGPHPYMRGVVIVR